MLLSDEDLEKLEKKYFDNILYILKANKNDIENRLKSGSFIKNDWKNHLKKKSEIDTGAERVIRSVLLRVIQWKINSTPISSDLCFEINHEAILHLDCKTVEHGDEFGDDLPGTFLVLPAQTSYPGHYTRTRGKFKGQNFPFNPKLPQYYHHTVKGEIPCITYFIKFVYEIHDVDFILESTSFYCYPNGQLSYYGNLMGGVKTYDDRDNPTECISTRIDAGKMIAISKRKVEAGWERAIEGF